MLELLYFMEYIHIKCNSIFSKAAQRKVNGKIISIGLLCAETDTPVCDWLSQRLISRSNTHACSSHGDIFNVSHYVVSYRDSSHTHIQVCEAVLVKTLYWLPFVMNILTPNPVPNLNLTSIYTNPPTLTRTSEMTFCLIRTRILSPWGLLVQTRSVFIPETVYKR